jgi:hypothetical protein
MKDESTAPTRGRLSAAVVATTSRRIPRNRSHNGIALSRPSAVGRKDSLHVGTLRIETFIEERL